MSIRDMYNDFEEAYIEEMGGENPIRTNFMASMELSSFMEGHGGGFDIRDHEQETVLDSRGVEVELRGYNEEESPSMNIFVQEILDTVGPDSDEGAGPFDVECDFLLNDYIMFRTMLRGIPTFSKNEETGKWEVDHHNITFEYEPVQAIEAAQDIFEQAASRYGEDHDKVLTRAGQILRLTEEKGLDRGIYTRYLNWAGRHYDMDIKVTEMVGFEFHYEPVLDNQTQVNSDTWTGHEAADLDYHDSEQHRLKMEGRYYDCFADDGSKQLCSEEFRYIKQRKTARIENMLRSVQWIAQHNQKEVSEMFRQGGQFKKFLQHNRSECLKPTGNFRTTFKSPYELWLTKPQADLIMEAAEQKKENNTIDMSTIIKISRMVEENNKK